MADGFLDKIVAVITKSDKFGFAPLFAGAAIFAGWHYQVEPFTFLSKEHLGPILFAFLFGTGLVLFQVFRWLFSALQTGAIALEGSLANTGRPTSHKQIFW